MGKNLTNTVMTPEWRTIKKEEKDDDNASYSCNNRFGGIAIRYGLDGPSIEIPVGDEIFHIRSDQPWGPPSLLYNGYRVFPGGKATEAWRWPPI